MAKSIEGFFSSVGDSPEELLVDADLIRQSRPVFSDMRLDVQDSGLNSSIEFRGRHYNFPTL
jgi:hypothetical protein